MSFDARVLKQLPAGEYLTSPDYPGLRFKATASKRTWVYRYRSPVDDSLRQVKIGNWPQVSVHAAIVHWENLRKDRDAGRDPALIAKSDRAEQKAKVPPARLTKYVVADVCRDYYEGHLTNSRTAKGSTEVRRMFDTMLGPLANTPAADISRSQAFDLIGRFASIAPVQASKLRSELGAAWDYALDAGRLPEATPNWWRRIMRGRVRSKGKKINGVAIGTTKRKLSPEEAGRLLAWLPNFTQLIADVLTLYFWTATRGAEIVAMRGEEISSESGQLWWTIPKEKTKNAKRDGATDLRVPLFGRALEVTLRRKEHYGEGYLFPAKLDGRDEPIQQKTIQSTVYFHQPYSATRPCVARARLTVTHWSPHDIRRTSRTFLAALGCPDEIGESILGHMLGGVLGVYNMYQYDKERVIWLEKLSTYLESLAPVLDSRNVESLSS